MTIPFFKITYAYFTTILLKFLWFYKEWQKYVHDEAYVFPTLSGDQITAVNKRVKYYSTDIASNNPKNAINEMELVADTPVK